MRVDTFAMPPIATVGEWDGPEGAAESTGQAPRPSVRG